MKFSSPEEARLNAGFDQSQLAERAGVSQQTVSRLERGETKYLQALTVEKIGVALLQGCKARGIEFSVGEFIAMCIARRDRKLDRGGFAQKRRTA